MRRLSMSLAALACAATAVAAQQRSDSQATPRDNPQGQYSQGQMQGWAGGGGRGMRGMLFFKDNNADLSDSAKSVIDSRMAIIRRDTSARIMVVDHASSSDSELVTRRLSAVKGYLVTKGVNESRIQVATRGTGWSTDTTPSSGAGYGRPTMRRDSAAAVRRYGQNEIWFVIASADRAPRVAP